jgi:D-3-phosphoglycerate dehydrogenase
MKSVIIDNVHSCIKETLERYINVDVKMLPTYEELAELIPDYDILIMRVDPKIDQNLIDKAKNLKMICVCAAGLNHIDLEYAKQKGIKVVNAPGLNIDSVAELTIGRLIELSRHVVKANNDVKINGIWDKYLYMGQELAGKTLGIAGFGKIGRRVGELAKAFKMNVVAYDPYVTAEQGRQLGVEMLELDELLKRVDYITIHMPLTPETKGMISKEKISLMKKGSFIVNMGRGGIVDEAAAYDALTSGRLAGMGVDVMQEEPCLKSLLYELDNFVVTPHIGGQTIDSQKRIGVFISNTIIDTFNLSVK